MGYQKLFTAVANVFDGERVIENEARMALLSCDANQCKVENPIPLPEPVMKVLRASDAHPACSVVARAPLPWCPPQTSDDPAYIAHSRLKVHVELLGPDGLVKSDRIRLGLYGMMPNADYGLRTHPAEEIFVMMAGEALWKRGQEPYVALTTGERAFHPSMLAHANLTRTSAFMSAYVWRGDVSTKNYAYQGLPEN